MTRLETQTTGAAGAFFVAAELAQRRWNASLTFGNAPRTDVLAQTADGARVIGIQVKTRRSGDFQLGVHSEERPPRGADEWFVLTSLYELGQRPDFYVVPRLHIAALVFAGYRAWLNAPGRGGRKRNPTSMRAFGTGGMEFYHENWALLEKPAEAAPWRLPDSWRETAKAQLIGQPEWRGFKLPPGNGK